MIAHGDEMGRSQHGNNNVYCQDGPLSWMDWTDARHHELQTEFMISLVRMRAEHPVFRRRRFFRGRSIVGSGIDDIVWLRADGRPMTDEDWTTGHTRSLAIYLNGDGIPDRDELGQRIVDDSFLLLVNAHHQAVTFTLPAESFGKYWEIAVDTADPLLARSRRRSRDAVPEGRLRVPARAMLVLRRRF
jgi:glycogen operon protein